MLSTLWDMHPLSWYKREDFIESISWNSVNSSAYATISDEELLRLHQDSWIDSVYARNEKIPWRNGNLLQLDMNTFAHSFDSEESVKKEIQAYNEAKELRLKNGETDSVLTQLPHYIHGYFSFDNKTWWLIVGFQKGMLWITWENIFYRGCIIEPKMYLNQYGWQSQAASLQQTVGKDIWNIVKH